MEPFALGEKEKFGRESGVWTVKSKDAPASIVAD
jgi:hypothetical protein